MDAAWCSRAAARHDNPRRATARHDNPRRATARYDNHRPALVLAAMVLGALSALGWAPAPTQAAPSGLDVAVRSGGSGPVLVLTNAGAQPCRVAATTLGTVTAVRVRQGGRTIEAESARVDFPQPLSYLLEQQLTVLGAGRSVELPLSVVPTAKGHALETISWARTTGAVAWLYPIRLDAPLTLDLTYAVPISSYNGPPLCQPGSGSGSVGAAKSAGGWSWRPVAALGLGGAAVLGGLVLFVVLRRRRTRAAGVAALLMLALFPVLWSARPARADLIVSPEVAGAWAQCERLIRAPGGDPAGILPMLDDPKRHIGIRSTSQGGSRIFYSSQTGLNDVIWNSANDSRSKTVGTGALEPCPTIYHELFHAKDYWTSADTDQECLTLRGGRTGITIGEVSATRAENLFRAQLGRPQRDHYGEHPMPSDRCIPPDEQAAGVLVCGATGCAWVTGDPHLTTFDRRRYDFMAVGEFVAVRDTTDDFQIQVRQVPPDVIKTRAISVNGAIAFGVAGDRVELRRSADGLSLLVGGVPRPPTEVIPLPHGGSVTARPSAVGVRVRVTWPDGSVAEARDGAMAGISLVIKPATARKGRLEGLFGNFDGDPGNDIRVRGGPVIEPTFEALYPRFADSWRIDAKTSLFTYEAGKGPESYADRTFPDRPAPRDLPNRASAEALCRDGGVTDPQAFRDCVFDVALTGQPDFVSAALTSQSAAGILAVDGPAVTATISQPGTTARFSFAGEAGQTVAVTARSAKLAYCDVLHLLDAAGKTLRSGCVEPSVGGIDAVKLPATAQYTVVLDLPADVTGSAVIRVNAVRDQVGAIEPNGPAVAATIGQPAAIARFTFNGEAGQTVVVGVPSSTGLPASCENLLLLDPAGRRVRAGCVVGGSGGIPATALPAAGRYTIVVDPTDQSTGTATLVLSSVTARGNPIEVNGPAVTASATSPGRAALFTFDGRASQRIAVVVTASTMPSVCAFPVLLAPGGATVTGSGCMTEGKGGIGRVTLPATGRYTLVFALRGTGTGTAQVRITG